MTTPVESTGIGTERTAAEALGLLSEETRLDILRTVAEAQNESQRRDTAEVTFSEIYDRVDVDGTSKLSYHLGELTGTFLRKHGDGYGFTHAGEQMVRFILAENYRGPPDIGPVEADGTCLRCGETGLEATLRDQYFALQCPDCERATFTYRVTPAQARSHDEEELVEAVTWELAGDLLKMRQGVCPDCAGELDTRVLDLEDVPSGEGVAASFATASECRECLRFLSLPLSHAAAYHPESVAFHWEHGVDVMGTGMWEFHRHLHEDRWTADRVDNGEGYRVELRRDSATLRLYLDAQAAVTRTERVQSRDQRDRRS